MSRNARDSDLGYFILDTIIYNLISLNAVHGDVKYQGVSYSLSSPDFLPVACFRIRLHFSPTCSHTRRCPLRGPSSMFSRTRSQLRVFVWAKIEKRTNCFGVIVLSINFVHRVTLVKIFNSDLACWLTIICSSMIACSQTFFFYRQFSERGNGTSARKELTSIFSVPHPHLFALAVNKSFTVFIFRRAASRGLIFAVWAAMRKVATFRTPANTAKI